MKLNLSASLVLFACVLTLSGCEEQKIARPIAPADSVPTAAVDEAVGCMSENPEAILKCERERFGHMNAEETVEFLKRSAESLNRNEIPGGPYGVLQKQTGTHCSGYSCDIICAGQGAAQQQRDVLLDTDGAQDPVWGEAKTYPHIRVDLCDIR
jgi:hypothetical protein